MTLAELYDAGYSGTGFLTDVGAAWATKTAAGSTGSGTVTLSSSCWYGVILIALKPQTATTTSVVTSGTPTTYGAAVTFTATVTPSAATGTVNFYDGATLLGSGTLASGTASYITTPTQLAAGSHTSITATYVGNSRYLTSTSAAITQTVSQKALTVSGITAASTVYDGTTTAKLGGTAAFQTAEAPGTGTTSDGIPYNVDSVSPGTVTGTLAARMWAARQ